MILTYRINEFTGGSFGKTKRRVPTAMKLLTDKIRLGDTANLTAAKQLREFVKSETGQDLRLCYQCGKCSAGCPASYAMDITPRQVMRAIQFGLKDEVLDSAAIWLCLTCQTCSARCPKNVDITRVMEALRNLAIAEKRTAAIKEVDIFNRAFLNMVSLFGRAYEVGLAGLYNMRSGHLFANVNMLPQMIARNKLAFTPERTKGLKEASKIFSRVKKLKASTAEGK
jgi:heterodisulfide reductase subunit C